MCEPEQELRLLLTQDLGALVRPVGQKPVWSPVVPPQPDLKLTSEGFVLLAHHQTTSLKGEEQEEEEEEKLL